MRISGVYVHTGIRRSKQLVLTEELLFYLLHLLNEFNIKIHPNKPF